ncbi:synaptopodin isoform X2 [Xenopus tropicalis]|uniref:Synaptopodin n=1 Tax=Xenopus tropicalis TaxID=8364 RepID=A0A803J9G1_XENTR|nr:synaptopodin isoform X2 [Xenopus tropicalis]
MMLKADVSSLNTLGGPLVVHTHSLMESEQNEMIGHESWVRTNENSDLNDDDDVFKSPQETDCNQTTHWELNDQEPVDNRNEMPILTTNRDTSSSPVPISSNAPTAESVKTLLKIVPIANKPEEVYKSSWKTVPSPKLKLNFQQPKKSYISRSVSLTEKELKEAQSISDDYASQLSPTQSSCSKGALLFHRRRQKLNALEQRQHELIAQRGNKVTQESQDHQGKQSNQFKYEVRILNSVSTESQRRSCPPPVGKKMEDTSSDAGYAEETENRWGDDFKEPDFPPVDNRAPSPSASEEDPQISICANLKENLTVSDSNGLVNDIVEDTKSPVKSEQNGQTKMYSEVHLTLSKPINVANRTARPFGCKQSSKEDQPLSDKTALIDLLPPPTYAETLSSPPPVTRVRSPPAYSALYPTQTEHLHPVNQVVTHEEGRVTPQSKSGILESLAARRGPRKSMFTFIEKPKMAPNPDLLSMIQTVDERHSKPNKHVETRAEDEPFALGAEASSFQINRENRATDNSAPIEKVPDWSTGLKSPEVKAKPPPVPSQGLTEATGKGADLFARRQSRMERFVVESPSPFDPARSPSPAMSLPPSWKYATNAHTPPSFNHSAKVNQRSPKPAMPVAVTNTASESVQSQKELEISKRQPYQLQSSLFILSPTKDPVSALPRAAPPPKAMVESYRLARQTSCPTSPLTPSPTVYSPAYFNSIRSPPAVSPSPASDTPNNFGRQTPTNQVSTISPVPFSSTGITSPRTKAGYQAPRPTFSARSAGLESQVWKPSPYYK